MYTRVLSRVSRVHTLTFIFFLERLRKSSVQWEGPEKSSARVTLRVQSSGTAKCYERFRTRINQVINACKRGLNACKQGQNAVKTRAKRIQNAVKTRSKRGPNAVTPRSKRGIRAVETQTRYTLYLIRTVGECSHCEHVVTLAGCSLSSSSSIRESNFQHTLIQVPAIWDVVDKVPTKYNLDDLFTTLPKFNNPSWIGVKYSGNATRGDKDVTAWVKSLIEHLQLNDGNVSYTADISIEAFKNGLTPFLCSIDNRSDGVVLRSFTFDDIEWKLPVVIIEVHSSPYVNTLLQTAADVIDQFRLLRCFNANITECVGFTFPKYAGNGFQNKSCVTKVCVSFENFEFNIQLFPLAIEEVKEEIEATLKKAMEFCAKRPLFSFIRLSDADIELAGTIFKDKVFQLESVFSILLVNKTEDTYYKHVTSMSERGNLESMNQALTSEVGVKYVTLYSDRLWIFRRVPFYRYPAQLPPLPKDEVAQCLFDYMTMTAIALSELHDNGVAHLDVRIPNICFTKDYDGKYMVKLIDLDRCKYVTATTGSSYEGEMYRAPDSWTCKQLDWKQLGLLAAEIILEGESDERIVCSSLAKDDTFFNKLLLQGMCIV